MERRKFLKNSGMAVATMATIPTEKLFAGSSDTKVRMGIIGVGLRGQNHLELLLRRDDVELVSICDVNDRMLTSAKEIITKSGKKMPEVFTGDDYAWKKMLEKKLIDGIIIATPWEWHNKMILGSIDAGIKYVGSEVRQQLQVIFPFQPLLYDLHVQETKKAASIAKTERNRSLRRVGKARIIQL